MMGTSCLLGMSPNQSSCRKYGMSLLFYLSRNKCQQDGHWLCGSYTATVDITGRLKVDGNVIHLTKILIVVKKLL
ncbi:hypothetical protein FVEG_02001 [Fusarium verticillioides 7600]|uniref:Uncharacterized protein n=1 Tax=Gibberella moniliformis (strain M3125 / FGSC 7600) TaxID=334819 RepID=W7LU11_GIBM7|nr:hypothetical protein FVEG_02001 [Fusarium verticillioides 7600]EWG38954.1 hypothetical protein FVEG_02001 [Fusarium verticillioides 7600]